MEGQTESEGLDSEGGLEGLDSEGILNLYKQQSAEMEIGGSEIKARIRRGVRQGCTLSPYLINMFIEEATTTVKDRTKGLKMNGIYIHYIRFADYIAILADSEKELNKMLNTLHLSLEKIKLAINVKKTEVMLVKKQRGEERLTIRIDGERLEEVTEVCYLGSIAEENKRCISEIKRRI